MKSASLSACPGWSRQTCWRQGSVVTWDAAVAAGLEDGIEAGHPIIVSHDCDIAVANLQDEPHVEVIVGYRAEVDGNLQFGKSPRRLQLKVICEDQPIILELRAPEKRLLRKTDLAAFSPDPRFSVDPEQLHVLRQWLAARYRRHAFADEFQDRMSTGKAKDKLAALMKNRGADVTAVYFQIDGGANIDHSDGTPYQLAIILLYRDGFDPFATADATEETAGKVEQIFSRCFKSPEGSWSGIQLKRCAAVSESVLTVQQSLQFQEWPLDYVSNQNPETAGSATRHG